jgi:hypothetical protein
LSYPASLFDWYGSYLGMIVYEADDKQVTQQQNHQRVAFI